VRVISHSEASSLLDCQAKHAFAYTGALTGGQSLKPKTQAPQLREGRAWGAGVAAWHSNQGTEPIECGLAAMEESLDDDALTQQENGTYDAVEHEQTYDHLKALLLDYATDAEPLTLDRLEHEIEVGIPSRTGRQTSNRYRLQAFLDGVHAEDEGRDWIYEAKLRKRLTDFSMVAKERQPRWYAWAWRRLSGNPVAGVIVDERLNAVPSPVKLNKDGSPSKVQSCRPDAYAQAFEGIDAEPDPEVLAKLQQKAWHKRHVLLLTPRELDEAGRQLASVGSLVHQLDTGSLFPVRNPSPMRCPGCAFKDICVDPGDTALVDALYQRRVPKRDKELANAA
jgi:PD-(D/E)XK nuclease superfamily